jgi:regulator of sirC expression with transglutaminase-like and TPR domain
VDSYLRRLEGMAAAVRDRLPSDPSPADVVTELNRYLFDELGFGGNRDDYYDPRNSYLNEVLDRRVGIPISLSILYMTVGRRLGLALDGISFPGHFLVRVAGPDGHWVLDPFAEGVSLSEQELEGRLAQALGERQAAKLPLAPFLEPASSKAILVRMLRNLKAVYFQTDQLDLALWASDRILALEPERTFDLRDRGLILQHLECFRPALADLSRYLELRPNGEDAEDIRHRVIELQRRVSRLN